jgi:hypothetical protein
MQLTEAYQFITAAEPRLDSEVFVVAHTFEREGRKLHVALTARLKKKAKRSRVWKSKVFLTAFKNGSYGFGRERARSKGGQDGLFVLDRDYAPKNDMMKKIFDQFIDNPESGVEAVASKLGIEVCELAAARFVSHQMRLLGVMKNGEHEDWLILVDHDDTA